MLDLIATSGRKKWVAGIDDALKYGGRGFVKPINRPGAEGGYILIAGKFFVRGPRSTPQIASFGTKYTKGPRVLALADFENFIKPPGKKDSGC